jgi:hypothetical protein
MARRLSKSARSMPSISLMIVVRRPAAAPVPLLVLVLVLVVLVLVLVLEIVGVAAVAPPDVW